MIEEIKKRLEAGEAVELECVDQEGFLGVVGRMGVNEKILQQKALRVGYIDHDGDIMLNGCIGDLFLNCICSEEFKYFRIKEKAKNAVDITSHTHKCVTSGSETTAPESKPTFDDLIDVVSQAIKDKVLLGMMIDAAGYRYVRYWTQGHIIDNSIYDLHSDYSEGVDFINSLYTETFVIENEEDINKVLSRKEIGFNRKSMSVATLMNGNEILITRLDPDNTAGIVVYMRDGLYKNYLGIDVLKGATVTQKRGKQ